MGLMDIGQNNPYARINPFAAVIEGALNGWNTDQEKFRKLQADRTQQEQQAALLRMKQDEADRANEQAALVAAGNKAFARLTSKKPYVDEGGALTDLGVQRYGGLMEGVPLTVNQPNFILDQNGNKLAMPGTMQVQNPDYAAADAKARAMLSSTGGEYQPVSPRDIASLLQYPGMESKIKAYNDTLPQTDTLKVSDAIKTFTPESIAKWQQTKNIGDLELIDNKGKFSPVNAGDIIAVLDNKTGELINGMKVGANPNTVLKLNMGGSEKPLSTKDALNFQIKHASALKGVNEAGNMFDSINRDLAYITDPANKSAFDANFGRTGSQYLTRLTPAAVEMKAAMDRVKNAMQTQGLSVVKANSGGIGSMAVSEWEKMGDTVANASSWQSPERALGNYKQMSDLVNRSYNNLKQSYDDAWAGTQFYTPGGIKPPKSGTSGSALQNDAMAELARRRAGRK